MVGLAFTQHSTPPDLDDPSYTARADFLFDARRNELDILSAYASPERIPKKRQGAYNTLAVSNEGRAFIVDNQTLEGDHESDQPPFTENDPNQAWPCQAWPLTVSTLDWFARSLASTVMDYAAGGWQQAPKRAFYVTNTQDCRGRGAHWISVAIGLRWVSPPPL